MIPSGDRLFSVVSVAVMALVRGLIVSIYGGLIMTTSIRDLVQESLQAREGDLFPIVQTGWKVPAPLMGAVRALHEGGYMPSGNAAACRLVEAGIQAFLVELFHEDAAGARELADLMDRRGVDAINDVPGWKSSLTGWGYYRNSLEGSVVERVELGGDDDASA